MRLKDASGNDFRDNVLRGPVLVSCLLVNLLLLSTQVTRHPCKLPTDVQKVWLSVHKTNELNTK